MEAKFHLVQPNNFNDLSMNCHILIQTRTASIFSSRCLATKNDIVSILAPKL